MQLRDLIAPLSEDEFRRFLARREAVHLPNPDRDRFGSLFNWEMLRRLIESRTYPLKKFRLTVGGEAVPQLLFTGSDKQVDPEKAFRLLEQGSSLILNPLDGWVPTLDALRAELQRGTSDHMWTGAIISTGGRGALKIHFDPQDLLILQVEGAKRWRLFRSTTRNPVYGMPKAGADALEPILDVQVNAGDALFVPAGCWHECDNAAARSIHVIVVFDPLCLPKVASALVRRLLAEPETRRPLFRETPDTTLLDAERQVKALLIEELQRLSLTDVLKEAGEY